MHSLRNLLMALVLSSIVTPAAAIASPADSNDDSLFMVVLGDSVTMGVWADSKLGDPGQRFYVQALQVQLQAQLLAMFNGRKVNDLSNAKKYAAVIDRFFGYIGRPKLSALIGEQEYSIPSRINQATGRHVEVAAATVLAGCYEISDFALAKMERYLRSNPGHREPDLVFIDFNAMDFVFNQALPAYQSNVRRTLGKLAERFPHATFVASPLVDLVKVMTNSFGRLAVPGRLGVGQLTCADSYSKIGFDKAVGLEPQTPAADVAAKVEKLHQMQDLLDSELDALQQSDADHGYSGFAGKVIRVAAVSTPGEDVHKYLAADCIHPNVEGQKLLSEQIWAAIEGEL